MANTIYCDARPCAMAVDGQAPPATWLVSRLDGTFNQAYCDLDYIVLCRAVWESAQDSEQPGQPADQAATPPGPDDPTDEPDDGDEAVIGRIVGEPPRLETAEPSPRVVKRGTSSGRRAYEQRKRAKVAQAAEAPAPSE